ncbi:unnamed protein product [Leptidea sinapis]|uniref:Uncharacterized protein n=1 Tax=Leptidea sinapis TaxID=189913 RepID=A0A5E4QBQ2_9NEOP|nr:unnamed protein product [Leptidea sinapis]
MLEMRYSVSRQGLDKPRTAIIDEDEALYAGFNDVAPALDTRGIREDTALQQTLRTAGIGRQMPSRTGTGALAKAQEASALERQLIRMQEQANLGDSHNLDLTFCVLCNLADQYALNEMYTEALNTYQLLTKNKLFPHANRLKVNMGNIHFKMGEHPKALKLYRMALDQTPTAEKDLRRFKKFIANGNPTNRGLHLVLCSVALDDAEGGKAAFHSMLDVEPPNYHHDIAIDDLSKWSEARSLSEAACRDDPYSCAARVTAALSELAASNGADDTVPAVVNQLSAATHLDPANVIAMHDLALVLEMSGEENGAEARWQRIRSGAGAGAGKTLRALAACGLARLASPETAPALEHWLKATSEVMRRPGLIRNEGLEPGVAASPGESQAAGTR